MDPGWYFVTTHSFADCAADVLNGACERGKGPAEAAAPLAFVGSH